MHQFVPLLQKNDGQNAPNGITVRVIIFLLQPVEGESFPPPDITHDACPLWNSFLMDYAYLCFNLLRGTHWNDLDICIDLFNHQGPISRTWLT